MPSDVQQPPVEGVKGGTEGRGQGQAPEPRRSAAPVVPLYRYVVVVALFLLTIPLMRMADRARLPDKYAHEVGLKELPRQVAEWKAANKDIELDKLSLEQLTPDDYVWRQYTDPTGIPLDFLVVYGHRKNTFHSPGFCLPGGGWQIMAKSEEPLASGGLPVPMNLFTIQRQIDGQEYHQVVLYCFVQGDNATPSLIVHNLNLLRAHLQHKRSTGALVRVIMPVVSSNDVAVARAKDFITRIYPELRKRIG